MKNKKVVLFIIVIATLLILNSTNVFAVRAPMPEIAKVVEVYNSTSLVISIIMKSIIFIVCISYVVFFVFYMIKSKKDKSKKIKELIKWLIITVIIILVLWFGSETIKEVGKTFKYY